MYACEDLKSDREEILEVVEQAGFTLENASSELIVVGEVSVITKILALKDAVKNFLRK